MDAKEGNRKYVTYHWIAGFECGKWVKGRRIAATRRTKNFAGWSSKISSYIKGG
jgi:hypothetical protein